MREREYTQWGANGPGIVPVTGLRTRRDLAGKSDRPTDPIKLPTAFSGFCTHSYAHTLIFSLSFSFYSLPALHFLFCSLFHILYLTARLDSTTCFNFAQFFQHNNRFNRIFNCSSIGRTHTLCPGPGPDPDGDGPFTKTLFGITARACAFWSTISIIN